MSQEPLQASISSPSAKRRGVHTTAPGAGLRRQTGFVWPMHCLRKREFIVNVRKLGNLILKLCFCLLLKTGKIFRQRTQLLHGWGPAPRDSCLFRLGLRSPVLPQSPPLPNVTHLLFLSFTRPGCCHIGIQVPAPWISSSQILRLCLLSLSVLIQQRSVSSHVSQMPFL